MLSRVKRSDYSGSRSYLRLSINFANPTLTNLTLPSRVKGILLARRGFDTMTSSTAITSSPETFHQLVVFDFDGTLIDDQTDKYLFEKFDPSLSEGIRVGGDVTYTDRVSNFHEKLHEQGVSREKIEEILRTIPFSNAMASALRELSQRGDVTLLCLSNANEVYIDVILKKANLHPGVFQKVITNPAEWQNLPSAVGGQLIELLKVSRKIRPDDKQHQCEYGCSPALCKGRELESYIKNAFETDGIVYDCIVYVGDGTNDFCPLQQLRKQDKVFCRCAPGYTALHDRILQSGFDDKVKVICRWKAAEDLKVLLENL